jgi:hypothetical protein
MDSPRIAKSRTTVAVGLLAAFALVGCNVQPQLVSARSQQSDSAVIVEVDIPAEDAAKIRSREMYTYVRVGDCQNMEGGFPAEAYVGGTAVSEFSFSTEGSVVRFSGSIPAHIFEKYQAPCATLEGGGYFGGTIVADPISVRMDSAR